MRTEGWKTLSGADDGAQRSVLVGFDGPTVHAWVQGVRPNGEAVMGYASENLDDIAKELQQAMVLSGMHPGGAEVGLFGIGKALKKLAKKAGITKVIKKASKLADYALSNPMVKGALAATGPIGMSVVAAHTGYKMLRGYAKGHPKAMRFVKSIVSAARKGNPKAIKMQRILRLGQRAFGPAALRRYAVRPAGTPARYGTRRWGKRYMPLCPGGRVSGDYDTMAGADVVELGRWLGGAGAGVAYMGMDDDAVIDTIALGADVESIDLGADVTDADVDEAARELNEYAASAGAWEGMALLGEDLGIGAWEGLTWAAKRLGPHSMAAHPDELTARDALMDGRQAQAARFA